MEMITTLQAKTLIKYEVASGSTIRFVIGERCLIDNVYRVSIFIRSTGGDRKAYFLTNKKGQFARTFQTIEAAKNACDEIMGEKSKIEITY